MRVGAACAPRDAAIIPADQPGDELPRERRVDAAMAAGRRRELDRVVADLDELDTRIQ
jgi:hypothetical protein